MKPLVATVAVLVGLLAGAPVHAQQEPTAHEVFDNIIDGLQLAKLARLRLAVIPKEAAGSDRLASLFTATTSTRVAIRNLEQARVVTMQRYRGADEAATADPGSFEPAMAAKAFNDNYVVLTILLNRIAGNFERQMAALESGSAGIASMLSEGTQTLADLEVTWKMLGETTVLSLYSLVDMERLVDDSPRYLRITTAQRRAFVAKFEDTFGLEIRGDGVGLFAPSFAAHMMWTFLSTDDWLASDAP